MELTRRRGRRPQRAAGFTLIEVVIVLTILAVGLLSLLAAQVQAMRGGRTGRHTTEAMVLARDQMEVLHRMDWDDAALGDTTALVGPPAGFTAPVAQDNTVLRNGVPQVEQSYGVQYRVSVVSPTLKSIDVRVSWVEPDGRPRSHVLSSLRHDDP